jgi:hypothetical protein
MLSTDTRWKPLVDVSTAPEADFDRDPIPVRAHLHQQPHRIQQKRADALVPTTAVLMRPNTAQRTFKFIVLIPIVLQ